MDLEFNREINELISKPIKTDLNCLISLSSHRLLTADIIIFKTILKKWFNRFKTSQISRRFSLINSGLNKYLKLDLSNNLSTKLGCLIKEKYDVRTGKLEYPSFDQVLWIMNYSNDACKILVKLVCNIIQVFEDCTLWIKLGHFARQMRIITAAVSRLNIFFKTIVMKICDIYPYLYTYLELVDYTRLEDIELSKDIFHYLNKINVEEPEIKEVKSSSKVKFKSMYQNNDNKSTEDIGKQISRNLFNEKNKKKSNDLKVNGYLSDYKLDNNLNNSKLNGSNEFNKLNESNESTNQSNNLLNKINDFIQLDKNDSIENSNETNDLIKNNNDTNDLIKNNSETNDSIQMNLNDFSISTNYSDLNSLNNSPNFLNKRKNKKSINSDKNEIKFLIKEFKRRQSIKKAKIRKQIRDEFKFEVE